MAPPHHSVAGQMSVDDLAELGGGPESRDSLAADEEGRRTGDPQSDAGIDILLYADGLGVAVQAGIEGRAIEFESRSMLLQFGVGQIALVFEDQVVVLEELVLIGGAFRGPGRRFGPVVDAGQGKVPEDPTDLAAVDVLRFEVRKLLPGKPAAERSLEIKILNHGQWSGC